MGSAGYASRFGHRFLLAAVAVVCLCWWNSGCGGGGTAPPLSDAKARIAKLLHLYQAYVQKNQKGPPNEQAFREFAQKLSSKEREDYAIGDDVEKIFVSPRDNQPFVIQYNVKLDPGQVRAVAWEATGKEGRRFTALSMGYVEEYDEPTLNGYKK